MKCRTLRNAACLLVACVLASKAGAEPPDSRRAVPWFGESFDGALNRIDSDWKLALQVGEQTRIVPAAELVQWGEFRDSDRGSQIVLNDGGWLIGDVLQIGTEQLQVYSALWGEIPLPLAAVRGIVFNPSVAPGRRDTIRQRILRADGSEDLLLLENGDVIAGTARAIAEEETGVGVTSSNLVFVTRGREVSLSLNKITALIFNPSLAARIAAEGFRVLIGLDDGTRLNVEKIDLQASLVRLNLLGGMRLETEASWLWEQLTWLQPLGGEASYLSDLEPIGYKHIPLLSKPWPLGRDSTSRGDRLRADGCLYEKGLGMPSASRAAYALRGMYREFAAEAVLEDGADPAGSVTFRVFLSDGEGGWRAAFESPPVRGGDPPLRVVVDTSGVQAMALIVDMAERGDVQDRALWLNARLVRQE